MDQEEILVYISHNNLLDQSVNVWVKPQTPGTSLPATFS